MQNKPVWPLALAVLVIAVFIGAATAWAQSQRFSDVPPTHNHHTVIEWAAEAGVTVGYNDGTFKPDGPLSKGHAVIFMERYYDEILGADQSDDFTRGDMMGVLCVVAGECEARASTMTVTTTTVAPTTTTTRPSVTGSCTHWHSGHRKHTHVRSANGTVSGHSHQASSRTACGYLWQ